MNEFYNPITLKTQNIKVLITGATGYIGGRLIPRLLAYLDQIGFNFIRFFVISL